MITISVSELRNRFDEYIRRIKSGEAVIITKYGKPIAEFIPATMIQDKQKHVMVDQQKKRCDRADS